MSSAPQASRSRKRKQPDDNASAPRKRRQTAASRPLSPPSSPPNQPSWKTENTIALMNLAYWITSGTRPPKPPAPRRAAFLNGFTRAQLQAGFAHAFYLRQAAVDYNHRLQRQLDEVLLNPVPLLPIGRAQTVSSGAGSVHEDASEAGEEQGKQEGRVREGRDEEAARDASDQTDEPQDEPQSEPHNSPRTLPQNTDAAHGQTEASREGPALALKAISQQLVLEPRPISVPASTRPSSAPAVVGTTAVAPATAARPASSDSVFLQTSSRPSSLTANIAAQQAQDPPEGTSSAAEVAFKRLASPSPSPSSSSPPPEVSAAVTHVANNKDTSRQASPRASTYLSQHTAIAAPWQTEGASGVRDSASLSPLRSPSQSAPEIAAAAAAAATTHSADPHNPSPQVSPCPSRPSSPQPGVTATQQATRSLVPAEPSQATGAAPSPQPNPNSVPGPPPEASDPSLTAGRPAPPSAPQPPPSPRRAAHLAREEARNAARFAAYPQPYTAALQLGYAEGAAAGYGAGWTRGADEGYDAGNLHGDGWEARARCVGDAEHEADVSARMAAWEEDLRARWARRWGWERVEMRRVVEGCGVEELRAMVLGACLERDRWVGRNVELERTIARERGLRSSREEVGC